MPPIKTSISHFRRDGNKQRMSCSRSLSLSLVLVLVPTLLRAVGTNINDDDPTKIEALDYEYFKQKRPDEITKNCNTNIMLAYGLGADATSLGERNEICPNVQQNCCGVQDQKRIYVLWEKNSKRMAIHYKTVLLVYKYILGYGKKFTEMASKVSTAFTDAAEASKAGNSKNSNPAKPTTGAVTYKSDKNCNKAAEKILNWGFGERALAEYYYNMITQRVQFLHNTRRGFYCMLCSIEGQKAIHNTPWIFAWLYSDRIYYNREFCQMLVDHSFRITYELAKTFNHYLRAIITVTTCVSMGGAQGGSKPTDNRSNTAAMSPSLKLMLKNPLDLGDYFKLEICDLASGSNFLVFEKCEYWCQQWNIARPKSLFDGNAKSMKRLYDYLVTFEPAMRSPESNLFKDDMIKMKTDLGIVFNKNIVVLKFLYPISSYQDLAKFKSDFVYSSKGINPMEIGKGNILPFSYEFEHIIAVLMSLMAFAFLY